MKKAMKYSGIMVAFLLAFTLAFSTVTLANDEEGKLAPVTELKFIGNLQNQPVLQLSLNNVEEDEFTITFRDDNGNVLFVERAKGAGFNKKFLLKTDELGDATLHVSVKSKKSNKTEVYIINRSHSYVEETVVNKLK